MNNFYFQILSFAAGYLDRGREAGSPIKGPTEKVVIELAVCLQFFVTVPAHTRHVNTV